jgi:hypothetical protein
MHGDLSLLLKKADKRTSCDKLTESRLIYQLISADYEKPWDLHCYHSQ